MRCRLHRGALTLLLGLVAAPGLASGEVIRLLPELQVTNDDLTASFDVTQVFTPALERNVSGGLTNRVVVAVSLRPVDGEKPGSPLAVSIRQCEVVYDLWGDRYALVVDDGDRRIRRFVPRFRDVAQGCARVDQLPLTPVGALDLRRQYLIEVRVDINPVDPELLERTSEYLGDPLGHRRSGESGGTLFGAVAQIFFRDNPDANAEVHRFRSPPFGEATVRRLLDVAARRVVDGGDPEEEEE